MLADGSSIVVSACRSFIRQPACTGSHEPSAASTRLRIATSACVKRMDGPPALPCSGFSWSSTSAVTIFEMLAIDLGAWLPECVSSPSWPTMPTAEEPKSGDRGTAAAVTWSASPATSSADFGPGTGPRTATGTPMPSTTITRASTSTSSRRPGCGATEGIERPP